MPAAAQPAARLTREIDAIQRRTVTITREMVDVEKRTVRFPFSSEAPVERWYGDEVLDHKPASVRLDRLRKAGPLLFNHCPDDHLGRIEEASITQGRGYCTVRFGKGELASEKFQDVQDGILTEVSVGYRIFNLVLEEVDGDREVYRAMDWEPLEVSLVTIPADTSVGVGRMQETDVQKIQLPIRTMSAEAISATATAAASPAPVIAQVRDNSADAVKVERARIAAVTRQAEWFTTQFPAKAANIRSLAGRAIAEGMSPEAFATEAMEKELGAERVNPSSAPNLAEMEKSAKRRYSFMTVVRAHIPELGGGGSLSGFEREVSDEMKKKFRRSDVPYLVPAGAFGFNRRTLQAGVSGDGGYTVATDLLGAEFIGKLDNMAVVQQLGARRLSGLMGNVAIAKQTGGATAYWLGESDASTGSNPSFGQLVLAPHRLVVKVPLTTQFAAQTSLDAEAFAREDAAKRIALATDLAFFQGSGVSGEPKGLFNFDTSSSGIKTVTYGAAATFAKTREQIAALLTANSLTGNAAFVASPSTFGKWSTKSVDTGAGVFVWNGRHDTGNVGGYPGVVSNHLPSDKSVCGVFSEAILADWDGVAIVVDPYTRKGEGIVEVQLTQLLDIGFRHLEAFCVSTDSAAQ